MRYYTQKYRFPSKLQNEIKKKKNTVIKCKKKKTFLFEKIDKNVKTDSPFLGNS